MARAATARSRRHQRRKPAAARAEVGHAPLQPVQETADDPGDAARQGREVPPVRRRVHRSGTASQDDGSPGSEADERFRTAAARRGQAAGCRAEVGHAPLQRVQETADDPGDLAGQGREMPAVCGGFHGAAAGQADGAVGPRRGPASRATPTAPNAPTAAPPGLVNLVCEACKKPLRLPDKLIGSAVKCPHCAGVFTARKPGSPAPAAAPPAATKPTLPTMPANAATKPTSPRLCGEAAGAAARAGEVAAPPVRCRQTARAARQRPEGARGSHGRAEGHHSLRPLQAASAPARKCPGQAVALPPLPDDLRGEAEAAGRRHLDQLPPGKAHGRSRRPGCEGLAGRAAGGRRSRRAASQGRARRVAAPAPPPQAPKVPEYQPEPEPIASHPVAPDEATEWESATEPGLGDAAASAETPISHEEPVADMLREPWPRIRRRAPSRNRRPRTVPRTSSPASAEAKEKEEDAAAASPGRGTSSGGDRRVRRRRADRLRTGGASGRPRAKARSRNTPRRKPRAMGWPRRKARRKGTRRRRKPPTASMLRTTAMRNQAAAPPSGSPLGIFLGGLSAAGVGALFVFHVV